MPFLLDNCYYLALDGAVSALRGCELFEWMSAKASGTVSVAIGSQRLILVLGISLKNENQPGEFYLDNLTATGGQDCTPCPPTMRIPKGCFFGRMQQAELFELMSELMFEASWEMESVRVQSDSTKI